MEAAAAPASAGGRVVKRAVDAAEAARITAEAEVLAASQIPGVVELVGVGGDVDRPSLVTGRVPGPDLERASGLTLEEVAGVSAALATVLADLHELGLVHGAVMPSHVLLGGDGRPVLCGFGYGGRAGDAPVAEAPLPEHYRDPARRPGNSLAPAADVFALGVLLRTLVSDASVTASSPRSHPARWLRGLGRRCGGPRTSSKRLRRPGRQIDRSQRAALLTVADRATAVDPGLRLGARSFAAAVGAAMPGARLPRPAQLGPTPDPPAFCRANRRGNPRDSHARRGSRLRRVRLAVVAAMLMAAGLVLSRVVLGTAAGRPGTSDPPAAASSPAATVAPPATATSGVPAPGSGSTGQASSLVPPVTTFLGPACPAPASSFAADTDGDGCPEALRWSDGVLEAGDRRWRVGQPGDRVATADWSCSGRPTLAVLRPATGEVFVFDGWAEVGRDLVAELAGRVEGGFAIRSAELGDGCPRLAVERGDGAPVTLAPPRRP